MLTTQDVPGEPENKYQKLCASSPYDTASPRIRNLYPLGKIEKRSYHLSSCPFIHFFPRHKKGLTSEAGQVQPNAVCLSVCLPPSLQVTLSLTPLSRVAVQERDCPVRLILPVGGSWRLVCGGTGDLLALCQDEADRRF